MPDIHNCVVVDNDEIADNIFLISVVNEYLAFKAAAGQFLHIKCGNERFLRRPISISSVRGSLIEFVFEVKGDGTRWLSDQMPGQILDILGPVGNGFKFPVGDIILVGGGVGSPPMLFAAESARGASAAILGFRNSSRVILVQEFESVCDKVILTTDDGSVGLHGQVTGPLEELIKTGAYEAVMTCGQFLMQKAVAETCLRYGMPCQVSLEERMGCGLGACLVCACATQRDGVPHMSRVCIDGPVFDATDVVW